VVRLARPEVDVLWCALRGLAAWRLSRDGSLQTSADQRHQKSINSVSLVPKYISDPQLGIDLATSFQSLSGAAPSDMANNSGCDPAVAYLIFHRLDNAKVEGDIPIYANAEFDLGRDQVSSIFGVNDGTISKHHLRFHCVTYGVNDIAPIEPMVYVRTLSRHGAPFSQKMPDGSNSTCFLQSGHSPVLLNHGDILQLSTKISIKYIALPAEADERTCLGSTAAAEAKSFENQYTIVPRALGVGGFATVFLAINTKARRQVACKVVRLPEKPPVPSSSDWASKKGRQSPANAVKAHIARHRKKCQELRREFEVLKGIDHPNIIRLEKAIYATDHIFIFQELVTGGDLLSYLERKGGLDEPESAVIIFQLLKALEYLHSHGVVHRDIKPENILLTSWRKGARIVLTDFGQARKLVDDGNMAKDARTVSRMCTVVGTKGYAAPYVIHAQPSKGLTDQTCTVKST
jgi:tRNA A-37 threonylcarbamoyl transferase component Bud32